ncbi:MAG: alpha-amylase family glycosyl hydrolase [Paludibacteraceae bacterium]|nr:alpha-amylase family glycosyl hydrolase [Paludibacteraceae bacterium]
MKRTIFSTLALSLTLFASAQKIQRVEPLSWWTEMHCPLTLMLQGENLQDATVTIMQSQGRKQVPADGLAIRQQRNADSPNYLFLDMDVTKPGTYIIQVQKGKKKSSWTYTIGERRANPAANISYGQQDVIYLIMPDRFANGDLSNDNTDNTTEKANREALFGRHGGDIQGIINHLDEIKALGATAIWNTPLLLDNEAHQSYHGYACADYYHIDPRYGSNELYRELVNISHDKGLKMIMDIVPNHCGGAHWWMQDLPFADWIHQYPEFTRSNWQFSTGFDPYAAEADRIGMNSGWFDTSMPDMNLDNPDVLHYFQQWAIWWIEYANLDGLRVDTYPYNEKVPMSQWCKAVRTEYPGINIVGECWTRPTSSVAYWQADAPNLDGFNSNLPCVMDFPLQEAMTAAFGNGHRGSIKRMYEVLADDYLYAHPDNILIFDGNHDTPRVRDVLKDRSFDRNKLVITMLATLRGIPQLTYGEELGLVSVMPDDVGNHGALRVDYPGNWPGETRQLPAEQNDLLAYYTHLLNWRKNETILHNGKLIHYMPSDNTYAYFRYNDQGAVFVFINATEEEKNISWARYSQMTSQYQGNVVDVLENKAVDPSQITAKPLSAIILKLNK